MARRAFTLVELMVVIVIIGMLAALSLGALYAARQTARVEKTKGTITKIDRVIQARYEELFSRRVPFKSNLTGTNGKRITPKALSLLRLQVMRWIAKSELPDHMTDVTTPANIDDPVTFTVTGQATSTVSDTWTVKLERTAAAKKIFRRCNSTMSDNDNAELLYLIVSAVPEASEQFHGTEVGDIDGNGSPEFHDGWGRPIKWLRWPTGYESELMSKDPQKDHDPLDTRNDDPVAFRTVPLIWSNGPDGLSGTDICDVLYSWDTVYSVGYGKPVDASHAEYECSLDNITNHSIGMN